MNDTKERLRALVAEMSGIEPDRVTDTANFEELGIDSLDSVEIIMAIADRFGVQISDEEAEKCNSLNDLVKVVEKAMT